METLLPRTQTTVNPPPGRADRNPLKDYPYAVGLALVGFSTALFTLPLIANVDVSRDNHFGLFGVHFLLTAGYALTLKIAGRFRLRGEAFDHNIGCVLLSLVLSLVSCYALNRDIPVFQPATPWLSAYLVVSCGAFVGFGFRGVLPRRGQLLLHFLLGAALVLLTYLAAYLLPLYGIALFGLLALGLGVHAFLPLIGVVYLVRALVRTYAADRRAFAVALAGAGFPLLLAIPFLTAWGRAQQQIVHTYHQTALDVDRGALPDWVRVSQRLSDGWLTERILKTDLVYQTPKPGFEFWEMPDRNNFEDQRQHDPLVMIATRLFGRLPLEAAEKIKILEAAHDSRHHAQERLWTGSDLRTTSVATNVRLFPDVRLAYTEQTLRIRNTLTARWGRPQEAIYTFHLPEGAAVTSLSLWINGREERGYLTTKGKATKAYRTIVGVESRDPSVVHWQEGNRVSVRVFPCTAAEDRRFKIGITAPLRLEKEQLVYSSVYFDGPTAAGAAGSTRVQLVGGSAGLALPAGFAQPESGVYTHEGDYGPDWTIRMNVPVARRQSFSFGGKTYQAEPYAPTYAPFDARTVYLDLNGSWTRREMDRVWELVRTKPTYVFDRQLTRLTEENREELFNRLSELRFSLFPFAEIREPATSLVIAKSTPNAPNLRDLKDSDFSHSLRTYLGRKPRIRLYNLGRELSPYLKTLREFRVLEYDRGDVSDLADLLTKRRFTQTSESDQAVRIEASRMRVRESVQPIESAPVGNAPDHLLRLFAYHDILRNIGPDYFGDDYVNDALMRKAGLANVVSPVSSLIVLERAADYARFDITRSQNSLGNATAKSAGAVPEPHEWLLIALVAALAVYLRMNKS
ncbi:MAG: XrtN system VIT domain-containing protein [Ferruginibacter sp.]|nr:XrtN system VIT domain-containing protein [Cytophagales bacterium]